MHLKKNTDNAPLTAIRVDPNEQMVIMDALPLPLKQVVWSAPFRLDMRQVVQMQRAYSATAVARLTAAIMREYPEWRPV